MSRIIGILLDNAIEAAIESEEKIINVQFSENFYTNSKQIIIENTYGKQELDLDLIFKKDYTTKKIKGNSGIGLWKAKNMLEKEEKISLKTSKESNMFKQLLEINI